MQLKANYKWVIRTGLIMIGIAGLIFAAGDAFIPQEGNMFSASSNPEAFAELVTTDNYKIWGFRGLIGVPLEAFGTIALFLGLIGTAKEKLGFWGMMLCVLGDIVGISMFVFAYFVFPIVGELILGGMESAATIASVEPLMPFFGIGIVITTVGLILLAIAIWHAGDRFPKWSGIVVTVGFLLLFVQTSYVIQILGNLIWGGAYFWMAIHSWNRIPFQSPVDS